MASHRAAALIAAALSPAAIALTPVAPALAPAAVLPPRAAAAFAPAAAAHPAAALAPPRGAAAAARVAPAAQVSAGVPRARAGAATVVPAVAVGLPRTQAGTSAALESPAGNGSSGSAIAVGAVGGGTPLSLPQARGERGERGVGADGAAAGRGLAAASVRAAAGGDGAVAVEPGTGRPGGTVDLHASVDCGGISSGVVRSSAFAQPVTLALAADGGLYGQARIDETAVPGDYDVAEFCGNRPVAHGRLAVAELGAPDTGGGWAARTGTTPGTAAPPAPARGALAYSALGLTAAAALAALTLAYRRWTARREAAFLGGGSTGFDD